MPDTTLHRESSLMADFPTAEYFYEPIDLFIWFMLICVSDSD